MLIIGCWNFYHRLYLQCHDVLKYQNVDLLLLLNNYNYCNNMGENGGRKGKALCLWNHIIRTLIVKNVLIVTEEETEQERLFASAD